MKVLGGALGLTLLVSVVLFPLLGGSWEMRAFSLALGAGVAWVLNVGSYLLVSRFGGVGTARPTLFQLGGFAVRTVIFSVALVLALTYTRLGVGNVLASMLTFHGVLFAHETLAVVRLVDSERENPEG